MLPLFSENQPGLKCTLDLAGTLCPAKGLNSDRVPPPCPLTPPSSGPATEGRGLRKQKPWVLSGGGASPEASKQPRSWTECLLRPRDEEKPSWKGTSDPATRYRPSGARKSPSALSDWLWGPCGVGLLVLGELRFSFLARVCAAGPGSFFPLGVSLSPPPPPPRSLGWAECRAGLSDRKHLGAVVGVY